MKKLISIFMIVTLLICCFTATAFTSDQTVLTTTVPDATYTLNIPDDKRIDFGETELNIGDVSITNVSGFAVGKNIKVTASYDELKNDDAVTVIPYSLEYRLSSTLGTGNDYIDIKEGIYFPGNEDGGVNETVSKTNSTLPGSYRIQGVIFKADSEDWGRALGGDYSSTITFTAEVVSSNQ